ncbi:MAG: hypothetical protein N2504_06965 [candidate division WOR-3 bacterium]|nr:hypothetical protein [candidate division WOR-3 bacterium]MCX7948307.1 hypothetical protein [candidate division WOR-3 bacterium]MDW8151147.1 hypothetical protein [candidate division WOR-3 bacterium]
MLKAINSDSENIIKQTMELIRNLNLKKTSAIAFKLKSDENDDINLLIVSEDFSTNMEKRQNHVFSKSVDFPNIEVIAWTYDEYKKKSKRIEEFLNKLKKYGLVVKDDYKIF